MANISILEALRQSAEASKNYTDTHGGGGGGSTVTIADNPAGGVDLTVNGTTKTLANEETVSELNNELTYLETYVTPQMFKADDGSDDYTEAIEACIESGKPIYFPVGKYKISRTIVLKSGSDIFLEGSSLSHGFNFSDDIPLAVIYSDTDIVFFDVRDRVKFRGGVIYAPNVTKVINLNAGLYTLYNIIFETAIYGNNALGTTAISIDCSESNEGNVYANTFDSTICGFEYGYYINRSEMASEPWLTANTFKGVIRSCKKAFSHNISLMKYNFGGSIFDFMVYGAKVEQYALSDNEALFDITGNRLDIRLRSSDVGTSTAKQNKLINLENVTNSIIRGREKFDPLFLNFNYKNDNTFEIENKRINSFMLENVDTSLKRNFFKIVNDVVYIWIGFKLSAELKDNNVLTIVSDFEEKFGVVPTNTALSVTTPIYSSSWDNLLLNFSYNSSTGKFILRIINKSGAALPVGKNIVGEATYPMSEN